jgi:hypothetical protein
MAVHQVSSANCLAPAFSVRTALRNRARAARIEAGEAGAQPSERKDLSWHNDDNARLGPRAG